MTAERDSKTAATTLADLGPIQFLRFGQQRADTLLDVQKKLLDAYDEAGQIWLSRLKSEVDLWSDLAAKLTKSRSVPEGLKAYSDSVSQRLHLAVEDGQRLLAEGQKVVATLNTSFAGGWSSAATPVQKSETGHDR